MSWAKTTAEVCDYKPVDVSGEIKSLVDRIDSERIRMGLTMYAIERIANRAKDSYRSMRDFTHKPLADNFIGFAFSIGFKIEVIGDGVPSYIYDSSYISATVVSNIVSIIEIKRKSIDCSMMTMERASGLAPRNWAKTVNGKFRPTLFKLLSIFHALGLELRIIK